MCDLIRDAISDAKILKEFHEERIRDLIEKSILSEETSTTGNVPSAQVKQMIRREVGKITGIPVNDMEDDDWKEGLDPEMLDYVDDILEKYEGYTYEEEMPDDPDDEDQDDPLDYDPIDLSLDSEYDYSTNDDDDEEIDLENIIDDEPEFDYDDDGESLEDIIDELEETLEPVSQADTYGNEAQGLRAAKRKRILAKQMEERFQEWQNQKDEESQAEAMRKFREFNLAYQKRRPFDRMSNVVSRVGMLREQEERLANKNNEVITNRVQKIVPSAEEKRRLLEFSGQKKIDSAKDLLTDAKTTNSKTNRLAGIKKETSAKQLISEWKKEDKQNKLIAENIADSPNQTRKIIKG